MFCGGCFDFLFDIDIYGFDIRNIIDILNYVFIYGIDYCKDEVESGFGVGFV